MSETDFRAKAHDRIEKTLGKPDSDKRKAFDQLDRLLADPATGCTIRTKLGQVLGVDPTTLTGADISQNIIDQLWNQRRDKFLSILRGPHIRGGVRRIVDNLLKTTHTSAESIATKAQEGADRRRIVSEFIGRYNRLSLTEDQKNTETAINDLVRGKWLTGAKRDDVRRIGLQILQTMHPGHTLSGTTDTNEFAEAICAWAAAKISAEDITSYNNGEVRGLSVVQNLIQEGFEILKNIHIQRAPDIREALGFWKGGGKKHLKGIEKASKHRGGVKVEKAGFLKTKKPKIITPDVPKEIMAMGDYVPPAIPAPDYSDHAKYAAEQKAKRKEQKEKGPSLWSRIKNTTKLDESQRVPDDFQPANWEKYTVLPWAAHLIMHYGRRGLQFLIRNGLVRPSSFIWNKILKKPLRVTGRAALETGRWTRRLAYFATYPATLGIVPILRSTILKQRSGENKWWKIRPYKKYRADLKAKKAAK
ncbi:MAG: hypothetical protein V2A63_02805 [Patescibacteria group bacterium]